MKRRHVVFHYRQTPVVLPRRSGPVSSPQPHHRRTDTSRAAWPPSTSPLRRSCHWQTPSREPGPPRLRAVSHTLLIALFVSSLVLLSCRNSPNGWGSFPRGIVGGPNESAMNPDQSYSSNIVEDEFCEVRLLRGYAPRCGSWHHSHR